MALARLDVPSVMLYGGSIPPGRFEGHDVTIQDVFEAVGAHAAGKHERRAARRARVRRLPGRGGVRRAVHREHDGDGLRDDGDLADRRSAMVPAQDASKAAVARDAGALVIDVLRRGQKPSDIITRDSLENAIAAVACSGGSTNGVLHLLAARARGRRRAVDRRLRRDRAAHPAALRSQAGRAIRRGRPLPRRRRAARRSAAAGRRSAARRRADGHRAQRRRDRARERGRDAGPARSCGRSIDPLKPTGGLAILHGNLAPEGCVVKLAGHERRRHRGAGARLRERGGGDGRRQRRPRSSRATSS